MQTASRFIVVAGIALGCVSMMYFLSLVLHVSFFITVLFIVAAVLLLVRWTDSATSGKEAPAQFPAWTLAVLAIGTTILVQRSYPLALKHGGWDAWAFWNLHTKYLADPAHWSKYLTNPNTNGDHPDYPLLLPACQAFLIRLAGGNGYTLVPFIFGFSITLFIPVLIYLEAVQKNIVVAVLVLLLFAQNTFYLYSGTSQYADVPLAFFFLCALVCVNHVQENKRNMVLTAACLGCCCWTKNEGFILAGVFILFNARTLFSRSNATYFISGLLVPGLVLMIFKSYYAPQNGMVSGQNVDTIKQLFMAGRYQLTYKYFVMMLNDKFYAIKIIFFGYLALCVFERKWPDNQMLMLVGCMIAYLLVYVLSVEYLEWHLITSVDRLMLQLMPAMVYVISRKFSNAWFFTADQ